jgi:flagellar hook protein FlgE
MSLNSAMLAGVSGLTANSAAMAAVSDNIANVNTVAYKRNVTDFSTIVTGAANRGAYSAGGVMSNTRQLGSGQGLLQQTTSGTDLGISGSGFFVATEKAENLTPSDARVFTRAGSFTVDSQGFLKNAAGFYLQGWPVDDQGDVSADPTDLNRLTSINVGTVGGAPEATTRVVVNANLSSATPLSPAAEAVVAATAGAYDATDDTLNMSGYDPDAGTGVKPDYSMQIPISDSQGGRRTIEIDFLKSGENANEWYAEIRAIPADSVEDALLPSGQIATGVVTFTQDGQIDMANTTLFGTPPVDPVLSFLASDDTSGSGVKWAEGLGIAAQDVAIRIDQAPGGLTQNAGVSVTRSIVTNGTAFGALTSVDVDEDGFVTANFDNGVSQKLAQVAIATFPNPSGLKAISGNAYRVSSNSGAYNLKPPGTGGAGAISPSTLESSTVDLSAEFTGLITTQRAYSASSKIITTADQMMEELLNIKR